MPPYPSHTHGATLDGDPAPVHSVTIPTDLLRRHGIVGAAISPEGDLVLDIAVADAEPALDVAVQALEDRLREAGWSPAEIETTSRVLGEAVIRVYVGRAVAGAVIEYAHTVA